MKSLKQLVTLTQRVSRLNLTDADTLITVFVMPIMLLLFFVYVFGGNIDTGSGHNTQLYLNYAVPGFMLFTMVSASAYTGMRINNDKVSGMLDRLNTLPIKRWAILNAHVVASVIFMLLSEITLLVTALLIGYRPTITLTTTVLAFALMVSFGVAITIIALPFSLRANGTAGATGFSYLLIMLVMTSSALMPTTGMAKPVRLFAQRQPFTPIANASRQLLNGVINQQTLATSTIWLILLIVGLGLLAKYRYRQLYLKA
ncbi:ABC transporter permease [Furfurilactobacillus curtus]|uniref:Transport permease protein n=1 Tax=Furfurilactobacillus curtus TaxID=1746200 RepID=A0ABQ5JQZ4_9LACO